MGRRKGAGCFWGAVCILVAGILAGCGVDRDRKGEGIEKEEPVAIRIAIWDAEEAFAGDKVQEEVEKRFGIKIIPVNITWNDYRHKIKLWASGDSLPDLFVGDFRNSPIFLEWIEKGLLKAIPEDLSEYPHLEQYLASPGMGDNAMMDGVFYCIPRQTYPSQEWTSIDRIVAYRYDLARQVGIEKEPETWEEFRDMVNAVVQADPEGKGIKGMTATGADLLSGLFMPYASSIAAVNGMDFKWVMDQDGLYKPVYFVEDMMPAFQMARDMYISGVIDPDVLMATDQSAMERFLQGENAAILYSGGFGGQYGDISIHWEEVHGRDFMEDVKALSLMPDVNGNKTYPVWGYAWSETLISARVEDEKLHKILELYDYLLSDEGSVFAAYGPEGELYELEEGRVKLYDENTFVPDRYPSCGAFEVLVRWNPSFYDERFVTGLPEAYEQVNRQLAQEAREVRIPEYNGECSRIMKEKQIDFEIRLHSDFLRIMAGEEPVESIWEAIRKEYEEDGLLEVIREVNEGL